MFLLGNSDRFTPLRFTKRWSKDHTEHNIRKTAATMTGIADLYLYLNRPNKDRRKRLLAHLIKKDEVQRFVVLSWKRTGSNLLCGILHLHPQICMHNELFNPIDIFTYHPFILNKSSVTILEHDDVVLDAGPVPSGGGGGGRWTVQIRDLYPESFLEYIWDQRTIDRIMTSFAWKGQCKAVGFKSFPEHWTETRNEDFWRESILEDLRVKKIVLTRRDELAVYVSMKRADQTGSYMTHRYPNDLKIHVDPAEFQAFVNNYRFTFEHKYRSPILGRDTLIIQYEELVDEEMIDKEILPKLWNFLGVDKTVKARRLKETIKHVPRENT